MNLFDVCTKSLNFSRFATIALFFVLSLSSVTLPSTAIAQTELTLYWNAPSTKVDGTPLNNLSGYDIYVGNARGSYSFLARTGTTSQYYVRNLTAGKNYFFAVKAFDSDGNVSNFSNEVWVRTSGSTGVPPAGADRDADGLLSNQDNCDNISNIDQADFDGDGIGDACDKNPYSADFRIKGDYDGDGISDPAKIFGSGGGLKFQIQMTTLGMRKIKDFWLNGTIPASGDYNGDGKYDAGVVKKDRGRLVWEARNSANGRPFKKELFGVSTDTVVAGCYFDNDNITDKAVLTGTILYIKQSSNKRKVAVRLPLKKVPSSISCGDLDGDGVDEIIVKGNPKSVITAPGKIAMPYLLGYDLLGREVFLKKLGLIAGAVISADVNGDRKMDPGEFHRVGAKTVAVFYLSGQTGNFSFSTTALQDLVPGQLKGSDKNFYDGLIMFGVDGSLKSVNFYDMKVSKIANRMKGFALRSINSGKVK